MITRSLRLKLAGPAAFALFAAVSLGLNPAPAQANAAPSANLTAPTTFSSSDAAVQKPVRTATTKKKKKKKKKGKRRGSFKS